MTGLPNHYAQTFLLIEWYQVISFFGETNETLNFPPKPETTRSLNHLQIYSSFPPLYRRSPRLNAGNFHVGLRRIFPNNYRCMSTVGLCGPQRFFFILPLFKFCPWWVFTDHDDNIVLVYPGGDYGYKNIVELATGPNPQRVSYVLGNVGSECFVCTELRTNHYKNLDKLPIVV
jgi:hypothetical protein